MTTIDPHSQYRQLQAIFLRGHCRLIAAGMSPPRGIRKADVLRKAGQITKKIYKRGQFDVAYKDLNSYLESFNA